MSKKRAFTLVELLVVIAIIALLMSILMPALSRVKKQAKSVLGQSNLKQLCTCFSMYADDNEGSLMSGWHTAVPPGLKSKDIWMDALRPYYGNEGHLRCCPTATKPGTELGGSEYGGNGTFTAWGVFGGSWNPPAVPGDYGSFGINGYVQNPPPQAVTIQERDTKNNWRRADVRGAGFVPLMTDAQWFGGWPLPSDTPPTYDGEAWSIDHYDMMRRFCINRHDGYNNAVFLDCSIRPVGLKELWKLKWHRTFDVDAGPTRAEFDSAGNGWMKPFKNFD